MTGVMMAFSPCLNCKRPFFYNPYRVPSSSAITGTREPICRSCMATLNEIRRAKGLEPFVILDGAYDPEPAP